MLKPALDGIIALEHDKDYISRKMIFKLGKLFSNKPLVNFYVVYVVIKLLYFQI